MPDTTPDRTDRNDDRQEVVPKKSLKKETVPSSSDTGPQGESDQGADDVTPNSQDEDDSSSKDQCGHQSHGTDSNVENEDSGPNNDLDLSPQTAEPSSPSSPSRSETSSTASESDSFLTTDTDEPSVFAPLLQAMDDDSPSRKQWLLRKEETLRDIKPLDELMLKYGLESVKAHFLWVYDEVQAAKRRGDDPRKVIVLDTCFVGDPGSGKTMVANLYAELLQCLKLVQSDMLKETSPSLSKAWHDVTEELEERGILYINDTKTHENLPSTIETLVEETKWPIPVILLEVSGEIQDAEKFTFRPSSKINRMHVIAIPSYTEEELRKILLAAIKEHSGGKKAEGGWEGPWVQKYVSRAIKKAGSQPVPSVLQSANGLKGRRLERMKFEEQGQAPKAPENTSFTKSDMLGLSAAEIGARSKAWGELQEMIGMEKVKDAIRQLLAQLALNDRFSIEGKKPIDTHCNRRCFIGPPGTGKTTAAGLYGQILVDLKLVGGGRIVTKPASDLVGRWIGWSEKATTDALEEAQNGVLIIDDFHLLLPDATYNTDRTDVFRAAIIDTLVANIDPNSKRKEAIILIGYPGAMEEAFDKANPGLARRFPREQAFSFAPYNDKELTQILELKLRKHSLTATPKALKVAKDMLGIARHRPNFGNGGDVENLINLAVSRRNARCAKYDVDQDVELDLLPEDFDLDFDRAAEADERSAKLFEEMQGMDDILGQFQQYQVMATRLRSRGHDPRRYIPWALVFRGPPGTGKTTVARKIGEIYYDMGFLSAAEVVECSVADLTSPYVGGSSKKVIRMFERAIGKVLFIDEAYRLDEFNAVDIIGEVVDCMTKERFFGNLVVVLAGYKEEMENLMLRNRGLRSRFATHVDFHPLKAPDMVVLLKTHLKAVNIELDGIEPGPASRSRVVLLSLFTQLSLTKTWANGRDVVAFARTIIEHAYSCKEEEAGTGPCEKLLVRADALIPLLQQRLARARIEDAEVGTAKSCGNQKVR